MVAAYPSRGSGPDVNQLAATFAQRVERVTFERLIADAGYDSEANHCFLRDAHSVRTIIPPKHGRPPPKPASGYYRRLMRRLFYHPGAIRYGQRWQIETVFSIIKRRLGSAICEHTYWSQSRAMLLRVLTRNVMILRR